jgi:hypothetical protein
MKSLLEKKKTNVRKEKNKLVPYDSRCWKRKGKKTNKYPITEKKKKQISTL